MAKTNQLNINLEDLTEIMEYLVKELPTFSFRQRIDVAARLRTVAKHVKSMDELIKEEIKINLKNRPGSAIGEMFTANVTYNPVTRLDQEWLKQDKPKIHADFCVTKNESHVCFEPR